MEQVEGTPARLNYSSSVRSRLDYVYSSLDKEIINLRSSQRTNFELLNEPSMTLITPSPFKEIIHHRTNQEAVPVLSNESQNSNLGLLQPTPIRDITHATHSFPNQEAVPVLSNESPNTSISRLNYSSSSDISYRPNQGGRLAFGSSDQINSGIDQGVEVESSSDLLAALVFGISTPETGIPTPETETEKKTTYSILEEEEKEVQSSNTLDNFQDQETLYLVNDSNYSYLDPVREVNMQTGNIISLHLSSSSDIVSPHLKHEAGPDSRLLLESQMLVSEIPTPETEKKTTYSILEEEGGKVQSNFPLVKSPDHQDLESSHITNNYTYSPLDSADSVGVQTDSMTLQSVQRVGIQQVEAVEINLLSQKVQEFHNSPPLMQFPNVTANSYPINRHSIP